jgi:hypothetical protein
MATMPVNDYVKLHGVQDKCPKRNTEKTMFSSGIGPGTAKLEAVERKQNSETFATFPVKKNPRNSSNHNVIICRGQETVLKISLLIL